MEIDSKQAKQYSIVKKYHGGIVMTKFERSLLMVLTEEIILQLRSRIAEIEELHPRESALGIATFQERLWRIEELLNKVRNDSSHSHD